VTFDAVEHQLGLAAESIDIFMFVWRNDEIGNQLGQAVLAAADRGISVKVIKDRAAIMYERIDDSQRIESPGGLKKYNRVLASLQQIHQWLT